MALQELRAGTLQVFEQIHSVQDQPLEAYTDIRETILECDNEAAAAFEKIEEVLSIRKLRKAARNKSDWKTFFEYKSARSRHRPRSSEDAVRKVRNLGTLISYWATEVLRHYGWDQLGKNSVRAISACAKKFPYFRKDFVPVANYVMLDRHCVVASGYYPQRRLSSIIETSPLLKGDWQILTSVNGIPRKAYLADDVTFSSTVTDAEVSRVADSQLCKRQRAPYFTQSLLEQDAFGMLVQK